MTFVQIFISLLLIVTILIQSKGAGLENKWGRMGGSKRGAEKVFFIISIILAIFFLLVSIVSVLIG